MRCPVCRAENGDEASCRRCRADVSLLVQVELQRRRALKSAQTAAAVQNARATLEHARIAHQLRADAGTFRLLAVGSLLARDFPAALEWYRAGKKNPDATPSGN
jgi:hypothetical protein